MNEIKFADEYGTFFWWNKFIESKKDIREYDGWIIWDKRSIRFRHRQIAENFVYEWTHCTDYFIYMFDSTGAGNNAFYSYAKITGFDCARNKLKEEGIYFNNNKMWFQTEEDMIAFLLEWS